MTSHRPERISLLAVSLSLGLTACGNESSSTARSGGEELDPRPDVVLVVVDTLRADRLGCYGHERATSPQLDRFAEGAVLYERAISQAPWTTPSIASLLTSRYPTQLGILGERSAIPEEATTLAESLSSEGYSTAAVVSHSYCSTTWGFGQGFEGFDDSNVKGHAAVTSTGVTDRAIAFLEAASEDPRPFFLWVHYFDPHCAYVEHEEHTFGGVGDYRGPVRSGQLFRRLLKLRPELGTEDVSELFRLYDSEIAHTDAELGRFLSSLDELHPGALVVVTSDHGEEFMEHGDLGHAKTLYDEVVRVPLLVRYPDGLAGVEPRTVGLVDVFPTVLETIGSEIAEDLEGRSLRSAPKSLAGRIVFTETSRMGGLTAAVTDEAKVVHGTRYDEVSGFDLRTDPLERRPRSLEDPERQRLAAELEAFARRVKEGALIAPEVEVDGKLGQHLNELGYGGDDD